jgi:hypothetical protein
VPRAMINVVATAAMTKADPHKASAKIRRCWSQENRRRHPARAEVNTVMASNVGRSNMIVEGAVGSGASTCTLPMPRYRNLKLPLTI